MDEVCYLDVFFLCVVYFCALVYLLVLAGIPTLGSIVLSINASGQAPLSDHSLGPRFHILFILELHTP